MNLQQPSLQCIVDKRMQSQRTSNSTGFVNVSNLAPFQMHLDIDHHHLLYPLQVAIHRRDRVDRFANTTNS